MKNRLISGLRNMSALMRVLRDSRFHVALPATVHPERPCVILGNGPSLVEDIRGYERRLAELEVFCVGRFAEFEEYHILKPRHYVFADPMWWSPAAPPPTVLLRDRLFSTIASRTTWKMSVMAPVQMQSVVEKSFHHSSWIEPVLFNITPVSQKLEISKQIYDRNLGMPPVQNVLVACIHLALRMGHRNIVLLGADHSWHETIVLDDKNRVCLRDRHFYDKDVALRPFTMDGSPDKIFSMDQLFYALGRMFEGYWDVAQYANTLQASIRNASSTTYIDAFPRTSLENALQTPLDR